MQISTYAVAKADMGNVPASNAVNVKIFKSGKTVRPPKRR